MIGSGKTFTQAVPHKCTQLNVNIGLFIGNVIIPFDPDFKGYLLNISGIKGVRELYYGNMSNM